MGPARPKSVNSSSHPWPYLTTTPAENKKKKNFYYAHLK